MARRGRRRAAGDRQRGPARRRPRVGGEPRRDAGRRAARPCGTPSACWCARGCCSRAAGRPPWSAARRTTSGGCSSSGRTWRRTPSRWPRRASATRRARSCTPPPTGCSRGRARRRQRVRRGGPGVPPRAGARGARPLAAQRVGEPGPGHRRHPAAGRRPQQPPAAGDRGRPPRHPALRAGGRPALGGGGAAAPPAGRRGAPARTVPGAHAVLTAHARGEDPGGPADAPRPEGEQRWGEAR